MDCFTRDKLYWGVASNLTEGQILPDKGHFLRLVPRCLDLLALNGITSHDLCRAFPASARRSLS